MPTRYGQYCPISRALDVVGERWSLLILRDMLVGATRFNDIARGLPGLSRTLLVKRLRGFERAGLVAHTCDGYELTDAGKELEPIVFGLGAWGARWAFGDPEPAELDAEVLVWWMHTRLDTSTFPGTHYVVHVRFSDDRRLFWIVVERGEPSVCLTDPGFEVDVTIRTDLSTLYQVWLGKLGVDEALRDRRVVLEGGRASITRVQQALLLSPVAPLVQAAVAGGPAR